MLDTLVHTALIAWLVIWLLPWQPWRAGPRLEPKVGEAPRRFDDLTILIPARNEAEGIERTLRAALAQGAGLRVIVVDDQSVDGTGELARAIDPARVTVLSGTALPEGWTGKLWALEQGRGHVFSDKILLLDADIELKPGMLAALVDQLETGERALVSVMSRLRMESAWERFLMPPFIWFFRLLYPFPLVNHPRMPLAAAAGGCILLRRAALEAIGGFGAVRGALIDDCTLARAIKQGGRSIWLGLTHGAVSHRRYPRLADISQMVARTAYAQLGYSPLVLIAAVAALGWLFLLPPAALAFGVTPWASLAAWALMAAAILPTLHYYRLAAPWALTLPVATTLYLGMTLYSAWRHHRGTGAAWRGRHYPGATGKPGDKAGTSGH